jgi:hypothetical protein
VTILIYMVFDKGKYNFISLEKLVFILLHGLRKLILLKTKDRCTSLTVIGVGKIMCNKRFVEVTLLLMLKSRKV